MNTKPTLISLREVCYETSLSRTAINRWRAQGKFPPAVELGDKRVAFVRTEVEAWIKQRIQERAVAAFKREAA
jgi:predicted DNA-binding transcriptional regulator AlpA